MRSRRDFLFSTAGGFGGLALSQLLAAEGAKGVPHHKPKAKRVVQLFMAGGASHLDLVDFKPELVKQHG